MAKTNDTPAHVCRHCGKAFTGRKRKFCSDGCAAEAKQERDLIVQHLRRSAGKMSSAAREAGIQQFIADHGSWRAYLESKPGSDYYHSPLYKRTQRFRQARSQGRMPQFRPRDPERAIWEGHLSRRKNWLRYLTVCRRIDARVVRAAGRMSSAELWRWRYNNDLAFRAKEKERLLRKKQRRRHERALRSDGTITGDLLGKTKRCVYCNEPLTDQSRTIDHLIPLNKGGWHSASNVVECCRSCNSKKTDLDFCDWLDRLTEPHRSRAEREHIKRQGDTPRQINLLASAR